MLIFDVVPRSRSSGGERPPHTRKVTGSIPVGTTQIVADQPLFSRIAYGSVPDACQTPRCDQSHHRPAGPERRRARGNCVYSHIRRRSTFALVATYVRFSLQPLPSYSANMYSARFVTGQACGHAAGRSGSHAVADDEDRCADQADGPAKVFRMDNRCPP